MFGKKQISLEKIVSLEDWRSTQDSCSKALGVPIGTYDIKGNALLRQTGCLCLCELLSGPIEGFSKFGDICLLEKGFVPDKNGVSKASFPFGLTIFFCPIIEVGGDVNKFMVIGPVILGKRESISFYAEKAQECGIIPEKLVDALIEVKVLSHTAASDIADFVGDVFSNMARTGYHKKRLGEIKQQVTQLDPLFSSYYEQKILDSLLSACALLLNADSGSVMTVDKNNHLHISASTRMDKDIIEKTDMKIGEGIAGMAAASSESIVLPKDRNKMGVMDNMKRDQIRSSMIVPFNKANSNDVYGVLSLNVLREDKEFTDKDIALTKEMVNLASIALVAIS